MGKFPISERDKNRDQEWKMGRLGGNPKLLNLGGTTMRKVLSAACLGAVAAFAAGVAYANDELTKMA